MRFALVLLYFAAFSQPFIRRLSAEMSTGRIKGDDEPRMVSWRVLQGVTEPFDTTNSDSSDTSAIPIWKQMKNAADHKAASQAIQQALHEYGQLIRHPYMFGEMPMEERYDVFLSMSKLLKTMGFHQRAELLLYEAMSYTTDPHEAHLQLGLLFLDKEDLEKAKLHLKNCLFFRESDILILVNLAVILIAEGKTHEAQFFLSRVLSSLEQRVSMLSFLISERDLSRLKTDRVDYRSLSLWIEDLLVKVFYGEFRITPSATMDMLKMFSNLYQWLTDGEITGRFLFDLGQSLYEGGRPLVGKMMMKRGHETSNPEIEGSVSTAVVDMRLSLDYPVVPDSILHIMEAYLTITVFISQSSERYEVLDVDNVVDVYWSLPLLGWSALPMMPVLKELLWRFGGGPVRRDSGSQHWLQESYDQVLELFHPGRQAFEAAMYSAPTAAGSNGLTAASSDGEGHVGSYEAISQRDGVVRDGVRTIVVPPRGAVGSKGSSERIKIEVGILGGHMNNHPIGQMVYHRLLALNKFRSKNSNNETNWRELINLTLLALPLVPDATTKRIASTVGRVVNLPVDMLQAWRAIEELHLDVLVFPDWQPFPDLHSLLFQTRRIAPIQVCLFIRGSSCVSDTIDYYLVPEELQQFYLSGTAASDIDAKVTVVTVDNSTLISRTVRRARRPMWKELYSEQVVLLDWPIMTPTVVKHVAHLVSSDESSTQHRQTQTSAGSKAGSAGSSRPATESVYGGGHTAAATVFSPLEIEGRVFFDGQPVAVLPIYPTYMHPLMDETIFKIMRAVSSLHLVVALPDTFFTNAKDSKHQISWARKLIRRLWTRGGDLFNRIRLLPAPLNDKRLLQLLQQADLVLDCFPIGGSFYFLSLAISVGTPVVTMRPGTLVGTPKEDLKELRSHLMQRRQQGDPYEGNPLNHYSMHFDLPWSPAVSAIAGFYQRLHLDQFFVASSTAEYFTLARNLAIDR